ncbi:biopolymer transporter ExbD [Marinomonas sp. 15G1-11]|uniref:Biopolymer transporter ExbD n=1 Tax=Marinomonas phaeophyticola TaxID=3004091 RepID=A0ABT4JZF8_9GAMM|nr:biopolymer transporter ExbD [Marinomonas sp. 15G1-11]MCZ2723739.1 biopolymer transporter ExbD [Marinomonas sp. 15G1-11]
MILTTSEKTSSSSDKLDESMVPAINIVFLLLIFFMIAGHIESRSDQLVIPTSSSETDLVLQDIEIRVMAGERYYLNDVQVEAKDLFEQVRQLSPALEVKIICRIHKDLPASSMDPVLQAVKKLGTKQLLLVTEQ